MIVFPISKINLGLRITAKRPDGYHNIETIFFPSGLHDALEFIVPEEDPGDDILVTSGIETGAPGTDNLVLKALALLRENHRIPHLRIHLHKAIPVGAGLGGGSSDAACFIKSVNRFFSFAITDEELHSSALKLGSDCPFFIDAKPAYATGRGEIMSPVKVDLEGYYMVLLNPGVKISTKEAYANCIPRIPEQSLPDIISRPVEEWKGAVVNDFEAYAVSRFPLIGELKSELYGSGAVFSLMTGSGSSVFGFFRKKPELTGNLKKYLIYSGKI